MLADRDSGRYPRGQIARGVNATQPDNNFVATRFRFRDPPLTPITASTTVAPGTDFRKNKGAQIFKQVTHTTIAQAPAAT
jgi:hypothetical protein